jgi:hypothetical protein
MGLLDSTAGWAAPAAASPRPGRVGDGDSNGSADQAAAEVGRASKVGDVGGVGEGTTIRLPRTIATTGETDLGYAQQARRLHEQGRRAEYADHLETIAESTRIKILDLESRAATASRDGSALLAEEHRRRAAELSANIAELEARSAGARGGESVPPTVDGDPPPWARINADPDSSTAAAGIRTVTSPSTGTHPSLGPGLVTGVGPDTGVGIGGPSGVIGSGGAAPIDQTRQYDVPGGLRAPLAVHQANLENAMPRDGDGRVIRLADPRDGDWFRMVNEGGPQADPTRGLNCLDGVLALFDTYLHGRPRVSAPRTFDAYAHGDPDRPTGGEEEGLKRVRLATGTTFQNLCPFVGGADPAEARPAVDAALRNLANHLHNSGHGAFAFIITDLEGGGCHCWAAVNQNGTILFLDPQIGRIAEETPLYRHHGRPTKRNVVSMDALVVNGHGEPAPLPYHGPGQWTALDPASTELSNGLDDPSV